MACPSAEERDVELLGSLFQSERLDVVNEGEMSNVDSIEACRIGRTRRARNGLKRAKFDADYVPPPGGNQTAAALAAAAWCGGTLRHRACGNRGCLGGPRRQTQVGRRRRHEGVGDHEGRGGGAQFEHRRGCSGLVAATRPGCELR